MDGGMTGPFGFNPSRNKLNDSSRILLSTTNLGLASLSEVKKIK